MLADLKDISEAIQSLLALIGSVGFIYVVLMGLSFKRGRNAALARGKAGRAKADLPELKYLSAEREPVLFWKDEALLQGGLVALGAILSLLMYIVFMLLALTPPKDKAVASLASLLSYPNGMIGFMAFQLLITLAAKERSWDRIKGAWWLLALALAASIGTFWVILTGAGPVKTLIIQIGLLILQSNLLAYLLGSFKGEREGRRGFPKVRIVLADGQVVEGLSFHRGTEQDYRFFNPAGEERIIPSAQIGSIEYSRDPAGG